MLQYGPILALYWTQRKQMQESEYFTLELSLDINFSSRFVQYPPYPIACCLPHLSTVAQNCHGKSINLTAKRKRLAAKRKTSRAAKRKRHKAKRKPHGKKKKTHGKISSIPRGHFNSYFFCREVVVILFAMRLFFLPWGFSFCREVNSFAGPPHRSENAGHFCMSDSSVL